MPATPLDDSYLIDTRMNLESRMQDVREWLIADDDDPAPGRYRLQYLLGLATDFAASLRSSLNSPA